MDERIAHHIDLLIRGARDRERRLVLGRVQDITYVYTRGLFYDWELHKMLTKARSSC